MIAFALAAALASPVPAAQPAASNVLKTRHDTVKNSISNVRKAQKAPVKGGSKVRSPRDPATGQKAKRPAPTPPRPGARVDGI